MRHGRSLLVYGGAVIATETLATIFFGAATAVVFAGTSLYDPVGWTMMFIDQVTIVEYWPLRAFFPRDLLLGVLASYAAAIAVVATVGVFLKSGNRRTEGDQ